MTWNRRAPADRPSLPTFIIGGAPRCGTTFLCHALDEHPAIAMARPYIPEPKVFLVPAADDEGYLERYRGLFDHKPGALARGEKSSAYLENSHARAMIRRLLPDAVLVFIFRDPVARAYSNWRRTCKNGLDTLDFMDAIAQEDVRSDPLPPEKSYVRPFAYLSRSRYDELIEPYFRDFPRDRILVMQMERLVTDRAAELLRLQQHVGIDPIPSLGSELGMINTVDGPPLDPVLARTLREQLRPSAERFAAITGIDIELWGY